MHPFAYAVMQLTYQGDAFPIMLAVSAMAYVALASPSTFTLGPRQSDTCNGLACPGNGQPCSSECTCIDPLDDSRFECVPNSCIGVLCMTDADCCSSPLPFVCLPPPPNVTLPGLCAPTLPPPVTSTGMALPSGLS
ncbi:hypothetical protein PYCCODRAFT_414257 [Trametes coccinea BRFM310]|uniref:Uncharacterized protein n=1 Tax=Trametes coccinea (strain BRFM310) TaxID=1353009 RepID=A0A1Y2INM6_TRAC3|nr:hypothetical protein PYCCODRAFT_414257 [Trametes coccinea BRFM310]